MKFIVPVLICITYTNVVLKLLGVMNFSWLWVLMPVWFPVLVVVIIILLLLWAVSDINKNENYEYDPLN